jgi:hypothetical protein
MAQLLDGVPMLKLLCPRMLTQKRDEFLQSSGVDLHDMYSEDDECFGLATTGGVSLFHPAARFASDLLHICSRFGSVGV